jgi:hypothetical protein
MHYYDRNVFVTRKLLKMSAIKKTCKNHDSYTYSGKEMSPLGLGYTAEAEEVGTVMEGRDKTMWMVGIKNGVRVWIRVPTQVAATVIRPALIKEEPVIPTTEVVTEAAVEVALPPPADPAPAPAPAPEVKKKVVKKKPVAAAEEVVAVVEAAPAPEPAPAPEVKKKVAKKKPVAAAEEAALPPVVAAEPKKKNPTAFNIYMSYRTNQLKTERPEMDHKERFKQATADWKVLSDDQKKAALETAKNWAEAN